MSLTICGSLIKSEVSIPLPLFTQPVSCGFPLPTLDGTSTPLDISDLVIRHPNSTYYAQAKGDSMQGAGIEDGDVIIVDISLQAKHGDKVIAAVDGEYLLKVLALHPCVALKPMNPDYPIIYPQEGESLEIFGVVTHCLKAFR